MEKGRLEAFSDGVIAIIITIMVLELKVPHGGTFAELSQLFPVFFCYVLSFIFVGIYWNNHHHMLQAAKHVNGCVLWANLHLLFWLSLVPFTTGWMGENQFMTLPVAIYGFVLFMAGMAYYILAKALIATNPNDSPLASALGRDQKAIASLVIYALAIAIAFFLPMAAIALYALVACMWFFPDRRIERTLLQPRQPK